MQAKTIKLSELHLNTGQIKDVPKNPRFIKDERYEALKKSIEDDPEMLQLRELVAYDNNGELVVVLGNMRYRAMKELGYKDAPVKVLPAETEAKKLRAYIQKDNIAFGQNDWDLLGNEWDIEELQDFGLECEFLEKEDDIDLDEMFDKEEEKEKDEDAEEKPLILTIEIPQSFSEQIEDIKKALSEITEQYEGIKIK
nr:MAG TPA: ParB protein [Caudoviricetes sp.]